VKRIVSIRSRTCDGRAVLIPSKPTGVQWIGWYGHKRRPHFYGRPSIASLRAGAHLKARQAVARHHDVDVDPQDGHVLAGNHRRVIIV
jgi:hypothetical protein